MPTTDEENKHGSKKKHVWLRDVIAGQTSICELDEENHRFYYRGYSIEGLAEHCTFEEVAHLLLMGKLPDAFCLEQFRTNLRKLAETAFTRKPIRDIARGYAYAHKMDVLSAMVREEGLVQGKFADQETGSLEEAVKHAANLVALMSMYCCFIAKRKGVPFNSELITSSPAKNILLTFLGSRPDEFQVHLMNVAMILYAEHEFNAGTFAVRVAASAHTDIYSAILCGISTLRGTRHGGANEEAMKMLLAIGTPENVRVWCDKFFEKPESRLPGFGHAVYKLRDPRVGIMKPLLREFSQRGADMRWYEMCLALEEYMAERFLKHGKFIPANIDLWTAPMYYIMGIPINLYTPLFAAARVAGWCAHYLEVRNILNEPILRPRAEYIGSEPRPYVPIEKR
ncbi:MAG: citrate/2-methylcitrate synthase [Patescibacteria group bacterium]